MLRSAAAKALANAADWVASNDKPLENHGSSLEDAKGAVWSAAEGVTTRALSQLLKGAADQLAEDEGEKGKGGFRFWYRPAYSMWNWWGMWG